MPMARAGWVLRTLLLSDQNTVLRDRKTGGGRSVVRRCASGSELIDWLMNLVSTDHDSFSRHDVVGMWQALLEEGVIWHGKRNTHTHTLLFEIFFYFFCPVFPARDPLSTCVHPRGGNPVVVKTQLMILRFIFYFFFFHFCPATFFFVPFRFVGKYLIKF